jgi:hypothetical protein
MTRGRKVFYWTIGIVAGLYGIFAFILFPTTTINYRLALEAMTPDGPKAGSGVISIAYSSDLNLNGGGRKGSIKVTGEAVYLDLGQGKNLFVTLTDDGSGRPHDHRKPLSGARNAIWLPKEIFGFEWDWGNEWYLEWQAWAAKATNPIRDVPLVALPTTVTFRDRSDSKSVMLVDPRDIAASFGEGYALTKATLELTNDSPTEGVGTLLTWLGKYPEPPLGRSPNIYNPEFYGMLSHGDFKLSGGKL